LIFEDENEVFRVRIKNRVGDKKYDCITLPGTEIGRGEKCFARTEKNYLSDKIV